ncbi:hypothetical protein D3C84_868270 [compost metagenome]
MATVAFQQAGANSHFLFKTVRAHPGQLGIKCMALVLVQLGVEHFLPVHHAFDGKSKGLLNHLVTHARNRFLQVMPDSGLAW